MEVVSAVVVGLGVVVLLAAATLLWAWSILNWFWIKPKKLERVLRRQGLAGNSYKFPFGDLKEMSRMTREATSRPISLTDDVEPRAFPFVHQLINSNHHGNNKEDICFVWFGPTPKLYITKPEHIKAIYARRNDFPNPNNPLRSLLSDGLVGLNGDKWVTRRRILNPAFHLEKLKLMLPAFHLSCDEMVGRWEKLLASSASDQAEAAEAELELDVWPDLKNFTRDVISRTALGSSYNDGRRIFHLQEEQIQLYTQLFGASFPGWRFVPTKTNRRMKHLTKEIESLLMSIISEREKAMRAGGPRCDDLLGLMLEANMKEIQDQQGGGGEKMKKEAAAAGISMKDVMEECKLFYIAGQESTTTFMAWTMVLLSIHPEWQSRARQEVLQVFGRESPDFDGLRRLKIVAMILNEVLRLYPPVINIDIEVHEDTTLGELTIPAGVEVALHALLIHRDKELWGEDAKEFNPERFSEGITRATKNQFSFFPFGWGPRICIGQNFALIQAKMAIAMILQRFAFKLSPTYTHAPEPNLTLRPQYGVQLILSKA